MTSTIKLIVCAVLTTSLQPLNGFHHLCIYPLLVMASYPKLWTIQVAVVLANPRVGQLGPMKYLEQLKGKILEILKRMYA